MPEHIVCELTFAALPYAPNQILVTIFLVVREKMEKKGEQTHTHTKNFYISHCSLWKKKCISRSIFCQMYVRQTFVCLFLPFAL